jgi:hypothetical protein
MRGDRAVPGDVPREVREDKTPKERENIKELAGYTLTAVLRTSDLPPPHKAPEVSLAALEAARKKTEPRFTIDLSQTRARIVLASSGFVLPQDTEIRSRLDRYGHIVIIPGERAYHVASPGALRALLGERRLDVAPPSVADVVQSSEGARRFNLPTRRFEVTTRASKATFEIASVKDAGEGGTLLCRALLDLMSAPPSTPLCATDDMPLHAELRWSTRGTITFDVLSMTRRTDFAPAAMATPPPGMGFLPGTPAGRASEILLMRTELSSFRSSAIDLPAPPQPDAQPPAPESGLVLVNASDQLRFVWLDGVPVAWVGPHAREHLPSLVRGRYTVQWRTFLGDAFEPVQTILVPSVNEIGGDAGVP